MRYEILIFQWGKLISKFCVAYKKTLNLFYVVRTPFIRSYGAADIPKRYI